MPLYFLLLTVCQSSDVCSRKEKLYLEGKKNKLTREKKWQLHKELVKKKKYAMLQKRSPLLEQIESMIVLSEELTGKHKQ